MPVSPARFAAFDILLRVEREHSYASELLHSAKYVQLCPVDHSLATELVMGVIRWRSRLDDQIVIAASKPLSKLDLEVLVALRLALYQFGWLDRVPQRAALHESVELVKHSKKRSAAPFVNAVLRKLSTKALQSLQPTPRDEQCSSSEALASELAHPLWLVERWRDEYGLFAAEQICRHNQTVPTTVIRLRTPRAAEELRREGITSAPGVLLAAARRVAGGDVSNTQAFRTAEFVIQDEASQLVSAILVAGAADSSRILDCCAAPGGKTLAIADDRADASISGIELHLHRARLMRKLMNATPSGAHIHIIAADARHLPFSCFFDRVLADVPCSGTGTLSRHPEIKWRLKPGDLSDLQTRQSAILRSALAQVAPGGRLVYATCSLEREENEDVVERCLSGNESFRLLDCRAELDRLRTAGKLTCPDVASLTRGPYLRTVPGIHPCDGFFAAIIERI